MTYETIDTELGFQLIKRTDINGLVTFIPIDESNLDYINYLAETKAPK